MAGDESLSVEATPDALTDRQRRDAIARNLCARICDDRRTLDEIRVIDIVLGRLELGADRYGGLRLAADTRDWRAEAAEEVVDMAIYNACDVLRRRDERIARIECEAADDLARDQPVEFALQELATFDTGDTEPHGGEG